MKERIFILGKIALGTLLMALAINLVYEPMHMVTGGVSGLSILVKELTARWISGGVPVWLTNLLANIPIFIWGYFVKGKQFLKYTFCANLLFSAFLLVLPVVPIQEKDCVLAALYGAVLTGGGLGLVFAGGYSTGGTDLLSSILCHYTGYPVAVVLFAIDSVIIALGAAAFGVSLAAYAIISVFAASKIMDAILAGLKVARQVWIISEEYEKISREIMDELGRGVTCIRGRGMYRGAERTILLCAVGRREIVAVKRIVCQNDRNAFVIVQDAAEVTGEGFERMQNL